MCGVPYHSCDAYIARLIAKGYKVAICEQMEDPTLRKELVKREVVRVVTPGTVTDTTHARRGPQQLPGRGLVVRDGAAGLCFVDASTGELHSDRPDGRGRGTAHLQMS